MVKKTYKLASHTLLVGSGKGGVGKSTVAVNLAIALAEQGKTVGLLDADVYGPSIPVMLSLRRLSPQVVDEHVVPISKMGVRVISLGFFIEEARSVVWRGPILHDTLEKMLRDVDWGELDYLIVDLPPGTGDVQISLAQLLKIDGALVVTTPQEVAMLDAVKAINAFHHLDIPLLGIAENMAGFQAPGGTEVYPIFGAGKGEELALRFNTPLLASIPIDMLVREGGDSGQPVAFSKGSSVAAPVFAKLAERVIEERSLANANPFL
jgi:ATP-binding protein involved in chromosome partitioning